MKKIFFTTLTIFIAYAAFAQNPPARLKYFGFAVVDCGLDDPNDVSTITNYISEVDSFSNFAQMCVGNYTDTIITRVNLMNNLCVKPLLSTSNIFLYLADSTGPSGVNFNLYPDYLTRWNTFKTINASVLNSSKIMGIYLMDEPTWNGVTFGEMDTVCSVIKADFPNIPLSFVEAYTEVNNVQVPTTVDWIGFDRYGIYDVSTDSTYLSELSIMESKRSAPNQKMILVFEDEWNSGFWPAGWQPDTMKHVVQHYYDLALADSNVIGLAGFVWPGIASGWLGARSMPQNVINKTVQIGKMIKANNSPCNTTGIENNEMVKSCFKIYPNPVQERLNVVSAQSNQAAVVKIYNAMGKGIKGVSMTENLTVVTLTDLSTGLYFYQITDRNGTILDTGKFMKE